MRWRRSVETECGWHPTESGNLYIQVLVMTRLGQALLVPSTCFVAFIDETGHELLKDKQYPVYGLGGCGILGQDLERYVESPWREVRRIVAGDTESRLHASALRKPSQAQMEAIAGFFRTGKFARFAAVCTNRTALPAECPPVRAIARSLANRILAVANWTSFTELVIVFEHSERATAQIEEEFSSFSINESGQQLPVTGCVMAKSVGQPALEVADFVMHAAGRQARHKVRGRSGFVPDFAATFHGLNQGIVSYMEITEVQLTRT